MYKSIGILSIISLFFSMGLHAQEDVKTSFLAKLKIANQKTTSIESNFVQEKTLSIMNDVLVSTGKFYYKKPQLMKWDQQTPSLYYFILNGDKVKRFDGKSVKTISANSPQVVHFKDFILGTVNGTLFESDQFESTFSQVGNVVNVRLVPRQKSMQKRIDKIELVFDNDTLVLLNLIMFEAGGDQTKILFTDQKLNTITELSIFQ